MMASPDIKFSEGAVRLIRKLSGSLFDLLAKHALVSAYTNDKQLVTTEEVYEALDAAMSELRDLASEK